MSILEEVNNPIFLVVTNMTCIHLASIHDYVGNKLHYSHIWLY